MNQAPAPQVDRRTFGEALDRYIAEELIQLNPTTQGTNLSLIGCHLRPRFGQHKLESITAMRVKNWLDGWEVSGYSRARARSLISRVLDLEMLWGWIPTERNQMELVRVKSTERVREIVILSIDQCRSLLDALGEPYATMVLIASGLGLRVSEVLALHWKDFDFASTVKTLSLKRRYSKGELAGLKTAKSKAKLPIADLLHDRIMLLPRTSELLFPSPVTGLYYSASTILSKHIKPTAQSLGLGNVGWHSLRHSYRSLLDAEGTSVGTQKDLMRHSDISLTMDTYGRALPAEMRKANAKIINALLEFSW